MSDFLNRQASPLSDEQWEAFESVIISTARQQLVGRRFLSIVGPLGAGVQHINIDALSGELEAETDLEGEDESGVIVQARRSYKSIPILYKDFKVNWRDIETSETSGIPLDTASAAACAYSVALAEDDLIFNGHTELGISGIFTVQGKTSLAIGDWNQSGTAYDDVVKAIEALSLKGFYGPYALVVSPKLFAALNRVYKDTPYLELDRIKNLMSAGVFQSPAICDDSAVVVSTGHQNLDLVIAMDLSLAFLETTKMNHTFRVLEMVIPRIKRPDAICTLETNKC
ncbi:MAG TPA: bacteriocin family protein [Thermoanaerobacterales bacterium]|nr:bacteriocin family protein [Thermoanaerobacterales bacterium]